MTITEVSENPHNRYSESFWNFGLLCLDWRPALLGVICISLFLVGLGRIPFNNKQEPREALVIWEINHSGNWILPLRNGHEIPSKPPLYHWLAAMASQAAGRLDEFTARLPSALFAIMGVLLVYFTGAILWDRNAGFISGCILATSVEWKEAAEVARVDMTLTFALLCAFLFFLYLYRTGESKTKAVLLGFFLGLATLAKGPLGFVVPFLAYLVFLWARSDIGFLKKIHPVLIITTCAIVAGSWYALALWQGGGDFLAIVIKENFSMTMGADAGHPHGFLWYVPVFFEKMAPWSLFFLPAVIWLYSIRRELAKENLLYFVVWFVVVFVFFSAFRQKRSVYILSVYPAVALILGAWWWKLSQLNAPSDNLALRPAAYLSALSFFLLSGVLFLQILGPGIVPWIEPRLYLKDQAQIAVLGNALIEHRDDLLVWATACAAGGIFLVLAARKKAWGHYFGCMTALMVISLLFVETFNFYLGRQYSFKPFVQRALKTVDHAPLYFYHSGDFGVEFYADRHIPTVEEKVPLPSKSLSYIFVWEKDWKASLGGNKWTLIDASEGKDPMGKGRLLLARIGNRAG